jgi:EAL domain-containing protein (putative c-di-GMP-specific phosphodiesterase class I)/GGDEF domain-containing protein
LALNSIGFNPFFAPAGVMFFWFMARGHRGLVAAIVARWITDFAVYNVREDVPETIVTGLVAVGVIYCGAHLTTARTGKLDHLRDSGWFMSVGCVLTPAALAAFVGCVHVAFGADVSVTGRSVQAFFIGDAIAIAAVTPVLAYLTGLWPAFVDSDSSALAPSNSRFLDKNDPSVLAGPAFWARERADVDGRSSRLEGTLQAISIVLIPLIVFGLGSDSKNEARPWIALSVLPCLWVALRRNSLIAQLASLTTIVVLTVLARIRFTEDVLFLQVEAVMLAGSFATLYAVGVGRAQRRRAVAERQVSRQRFTRDRIDQVTGLLNRVGIIDEIERSPLDSALIRISIDRFEALSEGIANTDTERVINEVATRTLAAAPRCSVGRVEENSLSVVVPSSAGVDAVQLANRIVQTIAAARVLAVEPDALYLPVTVSAGVAVGLRADDKPEDLLRHAKIAVNRASGAGGNRVSIFDQSWREEAETRHGILSALRDALDATDQIHLAYQPIVRLSDQRIVGAEALVRWRLSDGSIRPPAEFIAIAEKSGLIAELGDLVFRLAVAQLAEWMPYLSLVGPATLDNVPPLSPEVDSFDFWLHVNLSPRQLEDPNLATVLQAHCQKAGVLTNHLCLELVETDLSTDPEYATRILQTLRDVGFHLALDDFGTGFSNVSWLSRFPIDALKIDRAFVEGMSIRDGDGAIVELIINLANQLKLSVSAEGIEQPEQVMALQAFGCPLGQGYLFSVPIPPADFLAMVMSQSGEVQTPGSAGSDSSEFVGDVDGTVDGTNSTTSPE